MQRASTLAEHLRSCGTDFMVRISCVTMNKYFLTLLYLACSGAVGISASLEGKGQITTLQKKLLEGYDKKVRAVKNHNHTTVVKFGLSLNSQNLDDESQTMSINAWLIILWEDEFLKWNAEDFGNLSEVHFSPKDVWTPDITLYNSKSIEHFAIKGNVPLIVTQEGRVLCFPPFSGEVPCELSLNKWPSDTHTCNFKFGSWSHHGEMIDIQMVMKNGTTGITLDNFENNSRWSLVEISSEREIVDFGEEYFVITFKLTVQRTISKFASYFISSGFALILVVVMSYGLPLQFHLIRIIFHMFSLFLFIVSIVSFSLLLPCSGGSVPIIVNYYSAVIILATFSLIITIVFCNGLLLLPIFHWRSLRDISKTMVQVVSATPVLRRMLETEIPYEDLDSELLNESEINLKDVTSSGLRRRTIIILRILNFAVGFTLTVSFFTVHYIMKSTIL